MEPSTARRNRGEGAKSTSSKISRSGAARKFRGLTCANCRARKIRCEGGPPTCKTCEVFHDECRYDKTPPVSQVIALARRLQEAEKELADIRHGNRTSSSPVSPCSPISDSSRTQQGHGQNLSSLTATDPSASFAQSTEIRGDRDSSHHVAQSDTVITPVPSGSETGSHNRQSQRAAGEVQMRHAQSQLAQARHGPHQYHAQHENQQQHSPATDNRPAASHLSVDEHGEICYYGPTSAVHDPPPEIDASEAQTAATNPMATSTGLGGIAESTQNVTAAMKATIAAHARESATWEEFAIGNASLETGIPQTVIARLLHMHWTWVSPMFMWVYRPAFVRDMATGGRYYSEFLLTVICAHAAKYEDASFGDMLLTRARRLLGTAIQQPSSIPTVQALLQLSARDLAHGSISRAWVYSGIAFRMASDLGLQHSGPGIRGIGAVDLEIRRRLFWSCYFWDKATSLYAGRLPAVTEVMNPDTLDLLDDYTEDETWCPYYGDALNLTAMSRHEYPPMKSHLVSCFVNSCRLAIIINDVIIQLYSRRGRSMTEDVFKDIKTRLDVWRANSPAHLRYEADDLPTVSPPPHIIAQNLLYYATVILAHRPFWSVSAYYQVCIDASKSIEKLILLLESTFGLGNITYLMGYCIYTGASAILEDAKSGQGAAHGILRTYLRALNAGMRKCPLLERSLHIIVKGLNHADSSTPMAATMRTNVVGATSTSSPNRFTPSFTMPGMTSHSSSHHNHLGAPTAGAINHDASFNHGANTHVNSYIPAFPYLGPEMPLDFGINNADFGMAPQIDSMAMLDCFPEMQMDIGEFIPSTSVI